MAVNDFRCDYMVFYDGSFAANNTDLIMNFAGHGGVWAPSVSRQVYDDCDDINYFKIADNPTASYSQGIYASNNCGTAATSLAITSGFRDVFLIGMDCRISEDMTRSHYHKRYNKKGSPSNSTYNHMAWGFETIAKVLKKTHKDLNIYNCSTFSVLDKNVIPFQDLKEVLID